MPRIHAKRTARRSRFIVTMGQEPCYAVSINPEIAVPDAEYEEMCYLSAYPYPNGSGIPNPDGLRAISG
jgi:hypothetical protein